MSEKTERKRQRRSRGKRADLLNYDQALVDEGKCGRPTRNEQAKSAYCSLGAGWGTDHVGSGACRKHGGNNPIKHGRYSDIAREKLGERHDRWRSDPELATIDGEVAILRGLMERQIEGDASPAEVADMAERVVKAVDVLLKHKAKFGITIETFNSLMEQMGMIVERHVKDPAIIAAISREWEQISIA